MSDTNFPMGADGGPDDLPRTLRREKEAREREAREASERMAKERAAFDPQRTASPRHQQAAVDPYLDGYAGHDIQPLPAMIRRLDVPFLHLVGFFMKGVFAMVPALILLGAILWGLGALLQQFFPQLVKMQILIWFPN